MLGGAVGVASLNPAKNSAVRRALAQRQDLKWLHELPQHSYPTESGVSEQPRGLLETKNGAWNRAYRLMMELDPPLREGPVLAIGIESGIFELDGAYQDICAVCIHYYEVGRADQAYGLSSGFALPRDVSVLLDAHKQDLKYTLDHACREVGLTASGRLGYGVGAIGILSGGLVTREDQIFEGVRNALFGLFPRRNG